MEGYLKFSHRILIDKALEASNWDLLKDVGFEFSTSTGRADYVLKGKFGPLCVIEAKVMMENSV